MQANALRTLEFDRIVEAARSFSLTPMGDAELGRLAPSTDPQTVAGWLKGTTETRRYLAAYALLPLRAASDLPQILELLAVEGRALESLHLLALAAFLESVDEAKAAIHRTGGSFPILTAASGGAASFKREIAGTRDAIDSSGEVVDRASPELQAIRERLRRHRSRLRSTLESFLRGRDTAKYLQEQVVTERNGRYVLVIRSEHRSAIPGIVHGSSTSGASLFLEPLNTVEINNDIVALQEQEREEVRRILLALTDAFRVRGDDVRRTIEAATKLDVLQARARFAESIDGVEPVLSADGAFELQAARHPLLKAPVPVTIKIVPPATVLLVTGPNTGGKTVALKTAGLLALMAQAGLHIPAATGSRLPVFRSVFADIGDEQSIEASLSTFSAHVMNIASMDRDLKTPALVLLDEVGSGTDPVEGGALGVAVVDHFRRRGATLVATSHYDALKAYASTTAGVTSAAFGFDSQTFAPTYRIVYGSPGRSLALEIAGRLGLAPSIVAAARDNLGVQETQLSEHLAKIDRDMRALEQEHQLATREREALEGEGARMRQREEALRQREEAFQRRSNNELAAEVRQARRRIDDVIDALRAKTGAIARDAAHRAPSTGDLGAARSAARAAVDAVVTDALEPAQPPAAPLGAPSRAPEIGDRVLVGGLGLEGIVMSIRGNAAELDVRGKRMRASVGDMRVVGSSTPAAARVRVHVDLQPRESHATELNVVGCTVDEALARTERFLDESLLGEERVLRLIHGYGTGQLKRALAEFLRQHPLVVRVAVAPPDQGGGGVTVVELKE